MSVSNNFAKFDEMVEAQCKRDQALDTAAVDRMVHETSNYKQLVEKHPNFALKSNDGIVFNCHKAILCHNSPFFDVMLSTDWVETQKSMVEVPDYDSKAVGSFLEYIYADKVDVELVERINKLEPGNAKSNAILKRKISKEKLTYDLLGLAHFYQVQDLQDDCLNHLSKCITEKNVVDIWLLSRKYQKDELKEAALSKLVEWKGKVEGFDDIHKSPELSAELWAYTFSNYSVKKLKTFHEHMMENDPEYAARWTRHQKYSSFNKQKTSKQT
jgi:hypothetical protein